MFEIRCDKKGNWAEIADAVYVETAQCEALSAEAWCLRERRRSGG